MSGENLFPDYSGRETAPGWGSSFQKRTNRSPPRDRNAAGRSNFQPRDLRREDRLLAGDLAKFGYADIRHPMFLFAARGEIVSGMVHDGIIRNARKEDSVSFFQW